MTFVTVVSVLSIIQSIFIMKADEKTFRIPIISCRRSKVEPETIADLLEEQTSFYELKSEKLIKIVDNTCFVLVSGSMITLIVLNQLEFGKNYPWKEYLSLTEAMKKV